MATSLPFDPRPACSDLFYATLGAVVFVMIPFMIWGHSQDDPYGYGGDASHINGFGWFLLVLLGLALIAIGSGIWQIVRPSIWSTHAWWWEAGTDVAAALAPLPRAPASRGFAVGRQALLAVTTGGASTVWHIGRAAAIANKHDKEMVRYRERCRRIETRRTASVPSAISALALLDERYAKRRTIGAIHRRSLNTRVLLNESATGHLMSLPAASRLDPNRQINLRAPVTRALSVVALASVGLFGSLALWGNVYGSSASQDPPPSTTGGNAAAMDAATDSPPTLTPEPNTTTHPAPVVTAVTEPSPVSPAAPEPAPVAPTVVKSAPVIPAKPVPPPEPTCRDLALVSGTYIVAKEAMIGLPGSYDLWPRVTVHNGSKYRVSVVYGASGRASNPDFPDLPLEMGWGADDPKVTLAGGETSTVDLGKKYGETLSLFEGGHVEKFVVNATASIDGGGVGDCPIPLTSRG